MWPDEEEERREETKQTYVLLIVCVTDDLLSLKDPSIYKWRRGRPPATRGRERGGARVTLIESNDYDCGPFNDCVLLIE